MFFQGVYTNITRVRVMRDRQEHTSYAAAFATAFDPEKALPLMVGFTQSIQLLVTTGATPAITIYLTYEDFGGGGRR